MFANVKAGGAKKAKKEFMRGDVCAVARLERRDSRADKSAMKLKRKLDGKKRNQRLTRNATWGRRAGGVLEFSNSTTPIADARTETSRAKLLSCRDSLGKRAFFVGDVLSGFEDVAALLVAPRSAEATPELIGREIAGEGGLQSGHNVHLIQTESKMYLGGREGSLLVLSKIHFPDGQSIFYVALGNAATPTSPPRSLGLDMDTHTRIVRGAATMLGVKLEV